MRWATRVTAELRTILTYLRPPLNFHTLFRMYRMKQTVTLCALSCVRGRWNQFALYAVIFHPTQGDPSYRPPFYSNVLSALSGLRYLGISALTFTLCAINGFLLSALRCLTLLPSNSVVSIIHPFCLCVNYFWTSLKTFYYKQKTLGLSILGSFFG
jgi:hypothetical protein